MEHPGGRNDEKCKVLWGMGRRALGGSASQAAVDLGPVPPMAHPVIQAVVQLPGLTVLSSLPTAVTCFLENINEGSLTRPSPSPWVMPEGSGAGICVAQWVRPCVNTLPCPHTTGATVLEPRLA